MSKPALLSTSQKVLGTFRRRMLVAEVCAMLFTRQPTDEEFRELQRLTRHAVGRVSQRARMILLSAQHRTVPEIATLFAVSPATVRFWLRRFEVAGPAGLFDAPRSGRPRKLRPDVTATLARLVQGDPQQAGFLTTLWTVTMLATALIAGLGVVLSPSTLRLGLHRMGLRWGRPRLAMPRLVDPDKAGKQWRIVEAVVTASPEAAILYADESRIQLLPLVRAMWHWVGQQVRVPTPGTNVSRTLFGALNLRTGRWTYLVRERLVKEDFLALLEHLLAVYPTGPIVLIVDNFSSHKAQVVQTWLVDHPRLSLHYLPTYCSQLNPVEGIWRQLKNHLAANRLYGSMPLLLETVDAFFHQMTPEQALGWAGQ